MARMRTIKAAAKYFKEIDTGSCITEHFIRSQLWKGNVPGVVMAGTKYLIDLDKFEEWLSSSPNTKTDSHDKFEKIERGVLRKINL